MSDRGRPLGAKLFLEGKEVPFIGATITSTVNQASIAYIDIIPHYTINNIKPRTHVAIAVRDYHNVDQDFPYVIAWEGEVYGFNFSKTPETRSVSLSAIDYTSYWDNVLTYFFNALTSLGKGQDIVPLGLDFRDAERLGISATALTHSTTSLFKKILKDVVGTPDPDDSTRTRDFLDGFVAILKKFGEINEFYSAAEKRLRLNDRILLQSAGNLQSYLKEQEALDWFDSITGTAGGFTTLRDIISNLMSIIFHDQCCVPFPSRALTTQTLSKYLSKDEEETGKKHTISQFIFKPNLYMCPPPMCNVYFPDEYTSFTYNRNFLTEPTRLIYKPEMGLPFGTGRVVMPHSYSPAAFKNYMFKDFDPVVDPVDDLSSPVDPGHFSDPISDNPYDKKREFHLLTNEERMKGILISREGLVPAASEFRAAFRDQDRATYSEAVANYMFYKKRFQGRGLQITGYLKLSVVPGFNVLILDESDAGQNMLAYCTTVTHRIYATEGGHTTVNLSYARTLDEQQSASTSLGGPPIPPWFRDDFGKVASGDISEEAQKEIKQPVEGSTYVTSDGSGLSNIYRSILGDKGSRAINEYYRDDPTLIGSVNRLLHDYKLYKKNEGSDVLGFIGKITDRDYVRIRDAFEFVGAETKSKDLREESFSEFTGGVFDPNSNEDGTAVRLRSKVIVDYRDKLKESRGFRG